MYLFLSTLQLFDPKNKNKNKKPFSYSLGEKLKDFLQKKKEKKRERKKKRPVSENMAKIIVLCCLIILAAFGSVNAQKIGFYELQKGNITLKFTNWGAAIVSVILPDRNGMHIILFWFFCLAFYFWFFFLKILFLLLYIIILHL